MYSFTEYLEEAAAPKSVRVKDVHKYATELLKKHFQHLIKNGWTIDKTETWMDGMYYDTISLNPVGHTDEASRLVYVIAGPVVPPRVSPYLQGTKKKVIDAIIDGKIPGIAADSVKHIWANLNYRFSDKTIVEENRAIFEKFVKDLASNVHKSCSMHDAAGFLYIGNISLLPGYNELEKLIPGSNVQSTIQRDSGKVAKGNKKVNDAINKVFGFK